MAQVKMDGHIWGIQLTCLYLLWVNQTIFSLKIEKSQPKSTKI